MKIFIIIAILLLAACQQEVTTPQEPVPDVPKEPLPPVPEPMPTETYDSTGGVEIEPITIPTDLMADGTYDFVWKITGGRSVQSTSIESSKTFDFATTKESAISTGSVGMFQGSLKVEKGTTYLRIKAKVDGAEYYSETLTRTVS